MTDLLLLRGSQAALVALRVAPQALALLRGVPPEAAATDTGTAAAVTDTGSASALTSAASSAASAASTAASSAGTAASSSAATGSVSIATGTASGPAPLPTQQPVPSGSVTSPRTTPTTPDEFPTILLSCLVWSALAVALIVLLLPERTREQRDRIRVMGLVGAGAPLLLALAAMNYEIGQDLLGGQNSFVEHHAWLTQLAVHVDYRLAADGVSLPLLLVSTLAFGAAMVMAWRVDRHPRLLVALLLAMETGVTGTLCARDLVLLVMFLGLELVATTLLVAGWGGEHRRRAAARVLAAGTVSISLLTVAAVLVGVRGGQGTYGFLPDIGPADAGVVLTGGVAALACGLTLAAFLVRLPLAPFNGWYTGALAEASPPVAAAMGGAASVVGGYGLMRIALAGFPVEMHRLSLPLALLAVLGAVWSGLRAVSEDDLRRLVGHVSTASLSVVLLAVAAQTSIALNGAVLLLAANALATTVLLLVAAAVQERSRTRDVSRMGGLAWQAPRFAGLWVTAALCAAGVPFLAGFAGLFQVVTGAYPAHRVATVLVVAASVLPTAALLWACQRAFFGPAREQFQRVRDASPLDLLALAPLVFAIVLLGVVPGRFLPVINNGVELITARLGGG